MVVEDRDKTDRDVPSANTTVEPGTKLVPVMVSVKGSPWTILLEVMDVMYGTGFNDAATAEAAQATENAKGMRIERADKVRLKRWRIKTVIDTLRARDLDGSPGRMTIKAG